MPLSFPSIIGWSDVGSWNSVWDVLPHDQEGNVGIGPVVFRNSRDSLARSEDNILTAVIGLENVVVVTTPDAVLVAARDKAEEVKALVEQLKAQNRPQADEHLRVYRPWGYYQGVDIGARYQVKRIVVKPSATLSLQKHFHRAEHWVVVHGTAEVAVGAETRTVHENEFVYIPIGSLHRLANPGKIPLELIEVQVGKSPSRRGRRFRTDDDFGCAAHHDPMLGAMEMFLQRKRGVWIHDNALDLVARADIDSRVIAPRTVDL